MLKNDKVYAEVLRAAHAGKFHSIMIAFPCSTASIARHFKASGGGPPVLRTSAHPDGLPEDQIPPSYRKELKNANRLLERVVNIAIAARNSSSKATIVFENPADRSENRGLYDLEMADHGSIFKTTAFKRLLDAVPMSNATFAMCKFGGKSQKYTTIYYTNDAASVLDQLDAPEYKCDHAGKHEQLAGGKLPDGSWASKDTAYPDQFHIRLAMAFTAARTGSPRPMQAPKAATERERLATEETQGAAAAEMAVPGAGGQKGQMTPATTPAATPAPLPQQPAARAGLTPIAFPELGTASEPLAPALGQQIAPRAASPPWKLAGSNVPAAGLAPRRAGSKAGAADRFVLPTVSEQSPPAPSGVSPSYTGFGGTPVYDGFEIDANAMEEVVAALVAESSGRPSSARTEQLVPMSEWFDMPASEMTAADHTSLLSSGVHSFELGTEQAASIERALEALVLSEITSTSHSAEDHRRILHALRADSDGAPSTHKQVVAWGEPWPSAELKEMKNHLGNGTWRHVTRRQIPMGRRLHRLLWVYKLKRDGTAKARLCVDGSSMAGNGIDFDQTFSDALKYESARSLFAMAARFGCKVRSIDLVAAYLQGEMLEGETVFCYPPAGHETFDPKTGELLFCEIVKPVYGMPQAGRRLQRKLYPWLESVGLRRLDDSDGNVFVYDDPTGKETFILGCYVDNFQIVHSVALDKKGIPTDPNSFYSKFRSQLLKDWEVVDEGPMTDLLGIQAEYHENGSITLHQESYIEKLLAKFMPDGAPKHIPADSLPFSKNFESRVEAALEGSTPSSPAFPHLVRPFQERLGSLMYLCRCARCDVAFPVHRLAQAMSRPTPELMDEIDHVLVYLRATKALGITYSAGAGDAFRGMSDASWLVRNSTSGRVMLWGNAALAWASRRQDSIALSSCEAEIVALSEAAKDVVYFRRFLRGVRPSLVDGPTDLSTDNKGALESSYNPTNHDRMKHVARRHYFIRDMVEAFEINVPYVNTHDNVSDFFTKPLAQPKFGEFRSILMNEAARAVADGS
ncbi:MAG: reverse transcriptase domain-containing protein [archaeon]|nr:reverse transcriptase domain-containing protein [archaeon]